MQKRPSHTPKANILKGCLKVMQNQAWGFVFGFLGLVVALAGLIVAIPQAAPIRSRIAQTFSGKPTPTPTLAPTPTPTPASQIIQINQTMQCTNCETGDDFALLVKSATIDPAQSQVTLLIGVKNISTDDKSEVRFEYLKLQDTQTGDTKDGGGEGFNSFAVSVNSQTLFRPTFQFVPVSGHEYSLSAKLDSFDLGWAYHLFSPINISL